MRSIPLPEYRAPSDLADALRLAALPGNIVVGGGTIVSALVSQGMLAPAGTIDLFRIEHDAGTGRDRLILSPRTTYAELITSTLPIPQVLRILAHGITGGPQIRNQATIGGAACYANPAADIPAALTALGADMRLASLSEGERSVPATEFFRGAFQTSRRADEILVGLDLPIDRQGDRWGYVKHKVAESSWPIVVAAVCVTTDPAEGTIATITVGGATEAPFTIAAVRLAASDAFAPAERGELLGRVHDHDGAWWSDDLADAAYRRRIAGVIAARAVECALQKDPA